MKKSQFQLTNYSKMSTREVQNINCNVAVLCNIEQSEIFICRILIIFYFPQSKVKKKTTTTTKCILCHNKTLLFQFHHFETRRIPPLKTLHLLLPKLLPGGIVRFFRYGVSNALCPNKDLTPYNNGLFC